MIHRGKPRPINPLTASLFGVALAALLTAALFPVFPGRLNIRVGDIASRTLRSPLKVSFISDAQISRLQNEAENSVPPVLVFDPNVQTSALNAFDKVIGDVSQVRAQPSDPTRKRQSLTEKVQLSNRSMDVALALPDDRWQAVQAEGRRVLGQELKTSLNDSAAQGARDTVDATISPDFTADEALLTADLIRPLIISTQVEDQALTRQAKAQARANVPQVPTTIEKNDVIVEAGAPVDDVAIEKLKEAGLLSSAVDGRQIIAVALLSAIAAAVIAGYLLVMRPKGVSSERHLIALAVITVVPALVAKLYLPYVLPDDQRHFLAFILPLAAAPILIAALLETDVAVVVACVVGVLVAVISIFLPDVSLVTAINSTDTIRLLLVYALAPIVGVYLVHRADRLNRYLTAGVSVAAVAFIALAATWFIDPDHTNADIGWMALSTGIGGVSAGVIAAGIFVTVGVLFGVTTRVQLMELSQLNSPLLRRLQDEAPGTFHHSVIVGNLAERAADLVGADPLLTRVGAYYHDIGKVLQPGMYIENQAAGANPHEDLSPEESATAIQQHVIGGIDLARRARLPERVQAFIPEHHGTRLVTYFYRTAAERDPMIDPEQFQYPGPRPQSRETAIAMLADSTEALIRSSADRSPPAIDRMIDEVIAERIAEGQLDDSDLTLRDLRTIADSFKTTMRAVYHPRVQYPAPTPLEARRRVLRLPLIQQDRDPRQRARRRWRKFEQ